ncbi:hypothetical protein MLD38_031035 [Melastoma candidum]|uniref:Uncharacterized protein n=1 Tax=Melastoma candidum TaxID=119954 RepID=A0ACB9MTG5_9MYRT|nr:hypothetical protein MLD38_031035 [Melastoma candidum]
MGEAPSVGLYDPQEESVLDDPKSRGESSTTIGVKTYFIGRNCNEGHSLEVRIFNDSTGQWVHPVVLGSKPYSCDGHSAVTLGEDRVVVILKGSSPLGRIWFLEVDSNYVREQKKLRGGSEVVAWSKGGIGSAEKPIVISGPSGVGKGTLISKLMEEFPYLFGFSVSHTTRAPRNMEKDGVHYHFTNKSVMEREIEDGKFLEYASVHGNLYGTSIEAVEVVADDGKRCILDIDVQGARSVKASSIDAVFIFICPPSMEELEKRLRARGTETEEQILKRLRNAEAELQQGVSSGLFDHILYNDNLEGCYSRLKKILGLDGEVVPDLKQDSSAVELPSHHTAVTKRGDKIVLECKTEELDKSSENLIVLDTSALMGGAPGRTRGIQVYESDSYSDIA